MADKPLFVEGRELHPHEKTGRGVGDALVDKLEAGPLHMTKWGFQVLIENPGVLVDLVLLLDNDRQGTRQLLARMVEELDTRPKYGDHLLAGRGITLIEGGQRGQTIPAETALTALKPVGFLKGRETWITGILMQERALDEAESCFAPWGRDLMWRVFNNVGGEGDAFLETLDKSKYYVLAGDQDLQNSDGDQVVLFLYFSDGQWYWCCNRLDNDRWYAYGRLFTLCNS